MTSSGKWLPRVAKQKLIEEFIAGASLPEGVLQVCLSGRETGAHLYTAGVDTISFTGS